MARWAAGMCINSEMAGHVWGTVYGKVGKGLMERGIWKSLASPPSGAATVQVTKSGQLWLGNCAGGAGRPLKCAEMVSQQWKHISCGRTKPSKRFTVFHGARRGSGAKCVWARASVHFWGKGQAEDGRLENPREAL